MAASEVMRTNYLFPLELLETAAKFGCNYFINTDSFFTKQLPDRLVKLQPIYRPEYTLSKYQLREWGKSRAIEGKINFVNLQMEHIYGPNDGSAKFIPSVIRAMKDGVASLDLTDGTQVRDFIHVEDVVNAYLVVLKKIEGLAGYHNFGVGTGNGCPLREFVTKIRGTLAAGTQLNFGAVPTSSSEIMYSVADITPLQELGWQPMNLEVKLM